MDCHCRYDGYYKELASGSEGNPAKLDCVCNVLDAYVDFATEKKKSDEDIDQLFDKIRVLLPAAVACQAQRIEKLAKYSLDKTEPEERIRSLADWSHHIDDPDMKNLQTLVEMAISDIYKETPHSRMDKVFFIEKFIDLAHGSGRMLDCACDYEVERSTQLGPGMTSHLTRRVLDCLAGPYTT